MVSSNIEKAVDRVPFAGTLDASRRRFLDNVNDLVTLLSYTGNKHGVH